MPRPLIVGFGRAGHGLHWSVLKRLRTTEQGARLIDPRPPVVHDFDAAARNLGDPDVVPVPSLRAARTLLDPEDTIVHLCTPPTQRLTVLTELAELGFRRILVEKPLVSAPEELAGIDALRKRHGLRLMVVAHWLESALTHRLTELIASGELGTLQTVFFAQRKPRILRTLRTQGHPTAFDVEFPHSVGVALRLAGDAEVNAAGLQDMRAEDRVVPEMGAARLLMGHHGGVSTEILSDLASPVRERVVRLGFSEGWAVGHFPISEEDDHAHLSTSLAPDAVEVFRDDSLGRFLIHAYREFVSRADLEPDFLLNQRVTRILAEAKDLARLTAAEAQFAAQPQPEVLPHVS